MGRPKGKNRQRSKQPEPSSTTTSTDELRQEQSKTESVIDSTSSETIKTECNPMIKALQRGDYTEALITMNEVCLRHKFSALVHRIKCSVHFHIASKHLHNSVAIQAHLEIAVEAAKTAVFLSPYSFLFALIYARMLYAASNNRKCYEEVVRVCEQALSIHNPIDPAKDTLNGENHYKDSTAEQRIAYVKKELQKLIEVSVDYSKKELSVQTKMEKELGEEFYERVAEARRLEQDLEKHKSLMNRLLKEKKRAHAENVQSRLRRIEQFDSYLYLLSDEQKLGLLEARISDFRAYLSSFKAEDILSEAISFAKNNSTWKFWACCCCDEKLVDSESFLHHLNNEHSGNLSSNLPPDVPTEVDARWLEMLVNGLWKPVDTRAAMRLIESQSKGQIDNPVDTPDASVNLVAFPSVPMLSSDDQKWPLSDDFERSEILEKIHDMFQLLLKHKYLTQSHLDKLVQYTMEEIQNSVPAFQFLIQGLDQSPLYIRFLGAPQLETVRQFLEELVDGCDLNRDSSTDDALNGNQGYELINEDESSHLLLNDLSLRVVLMPSTYDNSIAEDGPSTTSAVGHHETAVLPDCVFIGYLLSDSLPIQLLLESWTHLQKSTKHQGRKAFRELEKEWRLLQCMCEEKCEYMSRQEALQQATLSISTVLNAEQFQFEETLTGVTSCFCDLECCEDNKCNIQDYQHQEETYIKFTIQRQMKWLSTELSKIDANIMRSITVMKQLEVKLDEVSSHDYRHLMLPLLRIFIRAQVDCLVDKYAIERAEAAQEALLAEEDAQKNINKGGNQTKHTQEKSMNRKKKKDRRKPKEGKVTDGNKQHVLQEEDGEQPHVPVIGGGDYSNPDSDISETANTLKQRELEADERKLEEALEYQRRVENEAKQKQLAKQDEKTSGILQAEVAETITIGTRNDVVQTIETGNDGTRNDVVQTVEAQTKETRAVTFQNDEARDGARGEVAGSTLAAAVEDGAAEVSWMGVQISRTFVPLLEKALMHHPNLAEALASRDMAFHRDCYEGLGRVLQIFGMVANGKADESDLKEVHLILQDLRSLDLDVQWLDRRFAIAQRLLRHSQLVQHAAKLEDQIAKASAEIGLLKDEHRVMSGHKAELEGDYSLLTFV